MDKQQQLAGEMTVCMHRILLLQQESEKLKGRLAKIQEQRESLERELDKEKRSLFWIRDQILVLEGVSEHLSALRQEITGKLERSSSKEITVGEKERLAGEVKSLKEGLKKECPHQFVLSYDGYEGSYTEDYSNYCRGHRECVVCGFSEEETEIASGKYNILAPADKRMIKRDTRARGVREPDVIAYPLEKYLAVFGQSAGYWKAVWPKQEKGK